MYVYKQTEFAGRDGAVKDLFTVGYYAPDGKFEPESDHADNEDAADRVHFLNGGDEIQVEEEPDAADLRIVVKENAAMKEYILGSCDNDCDGDDSVGIPKCPFYQCPDIDDRDRVIPGGCILKMERR